MASVVRWMIHGSHNSFTKIGFRIVSINGILPHVACNNDERSLFAKVDRREFAYLFRKRGSLRYARSNLKHSTHLSTNPIKERPVRSFFLPLTGIEMVTPPAVIREILTTIGTNTGITSAILGGVAVTGSMAGTTEKHPLETGPSILEALLHLDTFTQPGWGFIFAQPCLLTATFISLQNIMTSLCVATYAWALPLSQVPRFVRDHPWIIASCGWTVAPNLAFLSFGLVCITENSYPTLAPYGLGLFLGLGLSNCAQTYIFLRTTFRLRASYFDHLSTKSTSLQSTSSSKNTSFSPGSPSSSSSSSSQRDPSR